MQTERQDLGVVGGTTEHVGVDAARVGRHVDLAECNLVLLEPRRPGIRAIRGSIAVHVLVFHRADNLQCIFGIEAGQAQRGFVMAEVVLAVEGIAYVAVLGGMVAGNTHREIFAGGEIGCAFEGEAAALANFDFEDAVGGPVKRRLLGMHTERATDGITPEQETLRATQYFRALEVIQARHDGAVTAFVQVVLEECGRRVAADTEVLRANTAYGNAVNERIGTVARDARRECNQVLDVIEVHVLDEIAGEGGNRQRHILYAFFAFCGRYCDFLDVLRSARRTGYRCEHGSGNGPSEQCLAEYDWLS